jgi:hypothetical protein
MKTLITTAIICTALYAGIGAIKNTTNSLNQHNQELNKALAMMER